MSFSEDHSHAHDHSHDHSDDHHHHEFGNPPPDSWRHTGVQVIPADSLDTNTAQTPGMVS